MSESQDPQVKPSRISQEAWDTRIVPTARACERFFWNVLWFALIVCVIFSFNPFH